MSFEDILRLMSKFTVARILERDDFFKRYKSGIPIYIHEFLYPGMQAYDSVVLKSDIEIGGTDQKFNMLAGRELQISYGQKPQVVITMPILKGIDGNQRMSKSIGNYIGLTESPQETFGKVMSIPDNLVTEYFKLALGKSENEIKDIEKKMKTEPAATKRALAGEIVDTYHPGKAKNAERDFNIKFKPSIRDNLSKEEKIKLLKPIKYDISNEVDKDKKIILWKLVKAFSFAKSNSDAKRLISQGAATINGNVHLDPYEEIQVSDGDFIKVGKKNYGVIEFMPKKGKK